MFAPATASVFHPQRIDVQPSRAAPGGLREQTQELLPFTVRIASSSHELDKAVDIRHSAYARHLPDFANTLTQPEAADAQSGVVVLLAESKLDGSALGTMRIQTNEFAPLHLEQSITLPDWMQPLRLAEATRLGVTNLQGGRLVTTVLFKAFYQYCRQNNVDYMVVTGRAPVDRTYDRLMFSDVFPGVGYMPIRHVGNLPHRVMSFNVATAQDRWSLARHPLLDFMCSTHHPDIDLSLGAPHGMRPLPEPRLTPQGAARPM